MQAKDGMQARAIGTAEEIVRTKAKTCKGVVSPKNGKDSTDRMNVERREQTERQQRQHLLR